MGFKNGNFWYLLMLCCSATASESLNFFDAVVIEAANSSLHHRVDRQVLSGHPLVPQNEKLEPSSNENAATNPFLTSPCFTSKGVVGRCMSFRQCYPYFKIPDLNNWDSWVLGMYDTCSYFTIQGRQLFGVCCTTNNEESTTIDSTSSEQSEATSEVSNSQSTESLKNPNFADWPPPLPTHPPHHTIPPLPTHPPSPHYPPLVIHPAPTPAYPLPVPTLPPPTPAVQLPVTDYTCGSKNGPQDQERIVGGHNADLGEWPWIAGLFNGGRQFCGGSLIDDIHILSAAHCVAHMTSWDVARLTVRLGDYNIKTNSEVKHIEKKVKRVVRHRGFDSRTLYNDVSILTLESPVKFTQQVRPICLPPNTGELYTGKTGTVIGWGSIRESGPQPAVLQEVNIPIWSNTDCRLKYGGAAPGGIVEHMLCAGQASKDSCSGDSGGPLMVNAGKWYEVGIVSWGIGCGKGQYPGVYTRVQTFLPWILKNLKQ